MSKTKGKQAHNKAAFIRWVLMTFIKILEKRRDIVDEYSADDPGFGVFGSNRAAESFPAFSMTRRSYRIIGHNFLHWDGEDDEFPFKDGVKIYGNVWHVFNLKNQFNERGKRFKNLTFDRVTICPTTPPP